MQKKKKKKNLVGSLCDYLLETVTLSTHNTVYTAIKRQPNQQIRALIKQRMFSDLDCFLTINVF